MKALLLLVFIATISICCDSVLAIERDMKITVNKPSTITRPNSKGSMSITIENLGPDSAAANFLVNNVSPQGPYSLSQPINYTFLNGPCQERSADVPPGDSFGAWYVSSLNAGESVICRWSFEVDAQPFADPVKVTWAVVPSGGLFMDPDWSNNNSSLVFVFSGAVAIPSLVKSTSGFLLLIVLLLGLRQIALRN